MSNVEKVSIQAQANIDFLTSTEGWNEVKNILSMVAFDMTKEQRNDFFELMKDENEKRNFLTYLFATTSIEAAIIQTK